MAIKITLYGKQLRLIRMERGELLRDMAEKLDITSSYLSAIENGKRNIPKNFTEKIIEIYSLNAKEKLDLQLAETKSSSSIKLDLSNTSAEQQDLALAFAKKLSTLDKQTINRLSKYLR